MVRLHSRRLALPGLRRLQGEDCRRAYSHHSSDESRIPHVHCSLHLIRIFPGPRACTLWPLLVVLPPGKSVQDKLSSKHR
jgi:hypothetical protein